MKNVFTRLTAKTLKANRTRTMVTIIGILLATAMLTAVTTFISSLQHYMLENVIAENGDWHGEAMQIPEKKVEELAGMKEVTMQVTWQELGYALNGIKPSYHNSSALPYYYVAGIDADFEKQMPIRVTEGRLPENDRELILSDQARWALEQNGTPVAVGDTLSLDLGERLLNGERLGAENPVIYRDEENPDVDARKEELQIREAREYTVVGYMEEPYYGWHSAGFLCFTRKDTSPVSDCLYTSFFKLKKGRDIYEFTDAYLNDYSVTYNSELLRTQGISANRAFMRLLYGMSVILILLIMTGGVSLVYNSFAISVSDRTKQFGLLASIGATPRQLRSMVYREALILSSIGIPFGILSGIAGIGVALSLTSGSFRYIYEGEIPMRVYVSWPALLTAALTALVTVLISAWIPARRAAKIPPMEAIRLSRDIRISGREQKRTRKTGRLSQKLFGLPAGLANRYFSRAKKQCRATVLSLFISIVLFVSASSYSTYLKKSLFDAKAVPEYDVSVYGVHDPELRQEIASVDGVEQALYVQECYPDILLKPEQMDESARKELWEMEKDENGYFRLDGELLVLSDEDYEKWLLSAGLAVPKEKDGQIPLIIGNEVRAYHSATGRYQTVKTLKSAGEPVTIMLTDYTAWQEAQEEADGGQVDQEPYQISVTGYAAKLVESGPMNLFAGDMGLGMVVSKSQLASLLGEKLESCLPRGCVYLKAANHQKVAEELNKLIETVDTEEYLYVNDAAQELRGMKSMLMTVDIFAYGFIALISLIAAANVFNTISTGFLLRRREFAVLSSVGMTPKEMNRMLSYECVLYGLKALLYGLPVSLLVTWVIYRVVGSGMDTEFYVPATSIVVVIASVFLMVFSTMLYAKSKLRKANIIDSIRQESL